MNMQSAPYLAPGDTSVTIPEVRDLIMKPKDIESALNGTDRCEHCAIRHMVLFADLQADDFSLIHQPIDDISIASGETLYSPGDTASHVYTVRSGLVKLVQYLPDGTQRIVRLLRQGDVAGMESILGGEYQHMAVTLSPVDVCRIPLKVIQRLYKETPRLHGQLMNRWQSALQQADSWLTELSTGSARARVARLLLRLSEVAEGESFQLMGREDMGAMLGITTETTSRVVAEYKRAGLLRQHPGQTADADEDALRAIAEA